jgi:uncharacterized protein (TIRG00374 family)
MGRRLRIGLGLGLGLGLCWLALRGLDPAHVWQELRSAEPLGLLAAFGLFWVSYRLRAVRWRWLLVSETRTQAPRDLFGILVVGYFLNNLLPARAGELARVALMRQRNRVPAAGTLATLFAERVMDGVVLAALGWWALEHALSLRLPWLRSLTVVFGVLFVLLLLAASQQARLIAWLGRRGALTERARGVIYRHAGALLEHLTGLARVGGLARVLAITLALWGVEAAAYFGVALAFDVALSAPQLWGFVAVVNFASLVPTPGGLGAVELAGASVLAQCGLPKATAFVLVSVQHALQYLLCLIFGLWHMARLGLLSRVNPAGGPPPTPQALRAGPQPR